MIACFEGASLIPSSELPAKERTTRLLIEVTEGGASAQLLFPLIYDELRRLAQHYLNRERPDHIQQATSLVHEVYFRLVDQTRLDWRGKAHFFAVAAQAMRRILIDHARRRARPKHGGLHSRLSLNDALTVAADQPNTDLVALDQALIKLAEQEPDAARVVEIRFFAGLSNEETAEVLGMSPRTVRRRWQFAKAWLYRELTAGT